MSLRLNGAAEVSWLGGCRNLQCNAIGNITKNQRFMSIGQRVNGSYPFKTFKSGTAASWRMISLGDAIVVKLDTDRNYVFGDFLLC
jgi:hypothetical protein